MSSVKDFLKASKEFNNTVILMNPLDINLITEVIQSNSELEIHLSLKHPRGKMISKSKGNGKA